MFNTTANVPGFGGAANIYPAMGWQAGGMVGYDFVGPRIELEGVFRQNQATLQAAPIGFQQFTAGANINQTAIMANVMYDFRFGSPIVPYIGAGAGIAFVNASALGGSTSSTQFAYQGIIGLGWNVDTNFRINLDGRYYGTTNVEGGTLKVTGSIEASAAVITSGSATFSTAFAALFFLIWVLPPPCKKSREGGCWNYPAGQGCLWG
jgi:opacity protein-like surface antigen